jgi:flavin reductase (DIM6/NTAB) family NADH-FMN oxidoreductase RutF
MATFDLRTMDPRQAYQLVTRLVAPRPIALVSTLDERGRGNLAPYSYFMMGGANPPSCVICPVNFRDGSPKHTLQNIESTGEYVINVVTRDIAEQVNQASYTYDRGVDEFDHVGLTRAPAAVVAPPRVAESPVALECRLFQVLRHGDGALSSNYIVGEILWAHVTDEVLTDGKPDDSKIRFVARLGASYWSEVGPANLFELQRPTKP